MLALGCDHLTTLRPRALSSKIEYTPLCNPLNASLFTLVTFKADYHRFEVASHTRSTRSVELRKAPCRESIQYEIL